MEFILQSSCFFSEQLEDLSKEALGVVEDKLRLIKLNPFRYKRIKGYNLFLFRIRFEDNRKENRIIYLVDVPYVKLLCILDRGKEYKDLKRMLRKLGYK